jgi:gliding motility-associated-like protein
MNRKLLLTFCTWLIAFAAWATHNRAGEIVYEHISGYTYKVTINTVTKASSFAADRPFLKIRWGDEPSGTTENQLDSLERSQSVILSSGDAKRNQYVGYHTYGGPGVYYLVMEDPNRNDGVINILNSVNQVFTIQTMLVISPATGHNNSVQLLKLPIEDACLNQPWIHNPVAFDPDGDSLVYSLVPCMGAGAEPLPGWLLPDASTVNGSDVFSINASTGDVTWVVPPLAGEFNIAIKIEEFRNGILVGYVIRDMQITVITCNNQPPIIAPLPDYCVEAGSTIQFDVNASDPNGNMVLITAFGGPLTNVLHEAEFNSFTDTFYWNPECDEVRAAPYTVSFEALDNGFVPLADIESVNITVVAPKVQNVQANAVGSTVGISWNPSPCLSSFSNYELANVRYFIYRRQNGYNFNPSDCEVGMPAYTGFVYIGQTLGANSNYYQDNAPGFGVPFCYRIVTVWPDGALSYASEEACVQIKKDIPVITKVSIETTDISVGSDTVWWSPPSQLDTLAFLPPYHYELEFDNNGTWQTIFASNPFNILNTGDTIYYHSNIDTFTALKKYRVKFYSNEDVVGYSSSATSPWLVASPMDNAIQLNLQGQFPWINSRYFIYRKAPGELIYSLLNETTAPQYLDTGLVNNANYCYKILTLGSYGAPNVPDSLYNFSQEICATPYDSTPPCAPLISQINNCEIPSLQISWNNINPSCSQDITAYNIYYAPTDTSAYTILGTLNGINSTEFEFLHPSGWQSIAGCFYITALDSLNLWPDGELHQNESSPSNVVCIDNCPDYELPNIITPDLDGLNDILKPFPYRSIESIDFKIFNRYGTLLFETTDPDILWNATDQKTTNLVSSGTYYYTLVVNTIRLQGLVPVFQEGYIQILNATQSSPQQ